MVDATTLLVILSASVLVLLLFYYRYLVAPYRVLKLKGPKPVPIFGNYLQIRKVGHEAFLKEQHEKYGDIFVYYVGRSARIVITDLEFLKEVLVKKFDSFQDRGSLGFMELAPEALEFTPGVLASKGETWRTGRQTLTPSFSAMKMKMMVPLVKRSTDVLAEKMGEFAESGKSVDLFKHYGMFTMEALLATAFGRYVKVQRGEHDQLADAASSVFKNLSEGTSLETPLLILILSNFPFLRPLFHHLIRRSIVGKTMKLFYTLATQLIEDRLKNQNTVKTKDMLQLMIDATISEGTQLTSQQFAGFSVDLMLAGYDTTANTLSYITYLLATNPDVQEKLQTEIDQYFEENPDVHLYEAVQKLKYPNMVLQETLRLYTLVVRVIRICTKDVCIKEMAFSVGTDVLVPINLIHHMSKYWPDPYKFDPERFSEEAKANRPKLTHMPFGWGLRSCIGMRFALLEINIVLIEIMRKYSFVPGPETVAKLEQVHGITSAPKNGVLVRIVPRQ